MRTTLNQDSRHQANPSSFFFQKKQEPNKEAKALPFFNKSALSNQYLSNTNVIQRSTQNPGYSKEFEEAFQKYASEHSIDKKHEAEQKKIFYARVKNVEDMERYHINQFEKKNLRTDTILYGTPKSRLQLILLNSKRIRTYLKYKLAYKSVHNKIKIHTTDRNFEAAYKKLKNVKRIKDNPRGFYFRKGNEIHLRPDSNIGEAIHELIHRFSDRFFREYFGKDIDEGVTQYFSDLVLTEAGLATMKGHNYAKQISLTTKLIKKFGEKMVADAYFNGNDQLFDLASTLTYKNSNATIQLHRFHIDFKNYLKSIR